MKTTNFFVLSKLTDNELLILASNIHEERQRRKRERKHKERRIQWITSHIRQYKNSTANHKVVGETVVVAVQWYNHIAIAKATPIEGDVFDLDTGIAVAFAKAIGERIPNYI